MQQPDLLFINGVELGTIALVKRHHRDPIEVVHHDDTPATVEHLLNLEVVLHDSTPATMKRLLDLLFDSKEALDVTFGASTLKAHLGRIKTEADGSVHLGFHCPPLTI